MRSANNIYVVSTKTFASMIDTYTHDNDFFDIYNQFYGNSSFIELPMMTNYLSIGAQHAVPLKKFPCGEAIKYAGEF